MTQPRHSRKPRPRQSSAPTPPQGTRVTVTVHPLTHRPARPPVDRARYARSVRIGYLIVAAVLFVGVLLLVGVL